MVYTGAESDCQGAKKSAQKELKALKGGVPKAIGNAKENTRGMRGKVPARGKRVRSKRLNLSQGGRSGYSSFRCPVS